MAVVSGALLLLSGLVLVVAAPASGSTRPARISAPRGKSCNASALGGRCLKSSRTGRIGSERAYRRGDRP